MDSGFYESKDGNYIYSVNGDGCSLRRVNRYVSEFIIPETIDGKNVKVVSAMVFEAGKDIIERVVFPNSVDHLEYRSFINMKVLRSVVLSGGINIIPTDSFVECNKLEEIVIPKGISIVQVLATHECMKLKRIEIYEDNLILSEGSFATTGNRIVSRGYEFPYNKLDGTPDYRYKMVETIKGTTISGVTKGDITLYVHQGSATERMARQYGYKTEILEK